MAGEGRAEGRAPHPLLAQQKMPGRAAAKGRAGSAGGFTLVEIVVVIAVASVIAVVAVPRLVGRGTFESRGFYDQATSIVRFAQKTAIAWRRPVFVCVSATTVAAGTAVGCSPTIIHPTTDKPLTATAPSGVTLTPVTFSFEAVGRPSPNSQVTIAFTSTIGGDPARQIVVEAETGYVRR
jgi:MSHA pilin protein MshC